MYSTTKLVPNRRRTFSDPDPLTAAIAPPANETDAERQRRQRREMEAKAVSDNIDEQIARERLNRKKRKEVRILLLGQSESGKSTTLKQFQLLHTPATFHAERIAWRLVIYLNLVRSIRRILEAIAPDEPLHTGLLADERAQFADEDLLGGASLGQASIIITAESASATSALAGTCVAQYEGYRRALAPLLALEDKLMRALASPDETEDDATAVPASPVGAPPLSPSWGWGRHSVPPWEAAAEAPGGVPPTPLALRAPYAPPAGAPVSPLAPSPATSVGSSATTSRAGELLVTPRSNWKKAFAFGGRLRAQSPKSAHTNEIEGWWEDPEDPVHVLNACAPVMESLWRDATVRDRLKERRIRLEESSGFYLDDIERVTAKKYFPTDADVLKARLKTTGVTEHAFTLKSGGDPRTMEWRIFDVGGERSLRHAWAPYFEDVNSIIFLAPISAFDQVLAEDPAVNRVEDSLLLWKSIASNKLLAQVNIILFLNKCDLLQRKLESGVRMNKYMVSYGDRPNDYEAVAKFFRNKFGAIHQTYTPNKDRGLFVHFTSVIDTRKTQLIITQVRDIILQAHLRYSHFV